RRARERDRHRAPPDRSQQRGHPLRHVVQARLLQGATLRRGRTPDEGVLREERDRGRDVWQGDRRHLAGGAAAAHGALRARRRQRRARRGHDRRRTAQGDRAARERGGGNPLAADRDRGLPPRRRDARPRAGGVRRDHRAQPPRDVDAGPNGVRAFRREGYTWRRVKPGELLDTLRFPGFRAMAKKYWKTGAYEIYRSLSKRAFVKALQRLVPALRPEDIRPGGAGV